VFAPLVLQAEDNTTIKQMTKTLAWPDGTRYVGGVMEGKRKGKGTIFWQDGTRFVGQFENDMRNGPGTMILPDGTVYTGFFKDDELVDTERTIAASAKVAAELGNEASVAALQGTELPMEADSLVDTPSAILMQVDENELLEPVSEPEPTIVLDEAPEPEEKIVAAAKTTPESIAEPEPGPEPSQEENYYSSDVTDITDSVKAGLIETVDLWAAAWSDQNVPQYIANYSEDFAVPGRQSRRNWEALRRTRIKRPGHIDLNITYQRFELVDTNIVDVFFRQAYRSNTYSDLTDKALRLRKEGTDWKVLIERSR
tara:strand:+ start:1149 stop:2084 length:936 start_codon:yes stop_codon:yes gene_type:complete